MLRYYVTWLLNIADRLDAFIDSLHAPLDLLSEVITAIKKTPQVRKRQDDLPF